MLKVYEPCGDGIFTVGPLKTDRAADIAVDDDNVLKRRPINGATSLKGAQGDPESRLVPRRLLLLCAGGIARRRDQRRLAQSVRQLCSKDL